MTERELKKQIIKDFMAKNGMLWLDDEAPKEVPLPPKAAPETKTPLTPDELDKLNGFGG